MVPEDLEIYPQNPMLSYAILGGVLGYGFSTWRVGGLRK